jgi:hypothetical protein
MLPCIVPAAAYERPSDVDSRFPLDETDYLGDGILWGNGDEHVDVIRQQVALFNATFFLFGQ